MHIALLIYWNIPTDAFSVGMFTIRYYGLFFLLAYITASIVFFYVLRKEQQSLLLFPVTLNAVFLSSLIGARLGECLLYHPQYYYQHPLEIILPFHQGQFTGFSGLSSHGACVGIPLALYLVARNHQLVYLWLLDRVALVVALAAVFIRLGNLANSEIIGIKSNLPWAFTYVRRGEEFGRHPVPLYEAIAYLFCFWVLLRFYKKGYLADGGLFALFLVLIFGSRFCLECFKAPQTSGDLYNLLNMGQYLSLPLIFLGLVLFMFFLFKNKEEKQIL